MENHTLVLIVSYFKDLSIIGYVDKLVGKVNIINPYQLLMTQQGLILKEYPYYTIYQKTIEIDIDLFNIIYKDHISQTILDMYYKQVEKNA